MLARSSGRWGVKILSSHVADSAWFSHRALCCLSWTWASPLPHFILLWVNEHWLCLVDGVIGGLWTKRAQGELWRFSSVGTSETDGTAEKPRECLHVKSWNPDFFKNLPHSGLQSLKRGREREIVVLLIGQVAIVWKVVIGHHFFLVLRICLQTKKSKSARPGSEPHLHPCKRFPSPPPPPPHSWCSL